ncbi:MAG: hypothetical protein COU31_03645 [Candidatus Magasanikbacteria bacterium CG10_big_fil_rev_8_21_14_0_10_40_10]|uniref:Uncharacterized protein n=1 Tax=Candidatus Magasanikbacteria bacterium CG10_big_fil_rev_8_21_14_0_10_40_10 TaxID=1974648 RepID=A0A2M6W3C3_9BACT|nr:MAG: hypothetical protein COU31_03645 [Candidatus Magasanikbacteria bacterium CG10_big_fil_rev_8_21_14_0_10_40_10]
MTYIQVTENLLDKEYVIVGTLKQSATLRECPNVGCDVIRYYAETATMPIIAVGDDDKWFQVTPKDDYGYLLNGYISAGLFVNSEEIITNFSEMKVVEVRATAENSQNSSEGDQLGTNKIHNMLRGSGTWLLNLFKKLFNR